jgi:hypothetical protein
MTSNVSCWSLILMANRASYAGDEACHSVWRCLPASAARTCASEQGPYRAFGLTCWSFQLQCSSHSDACMLLVLPVTFHTPLPSTEAHQAPREPATCT